MPLSQTKRIKYAILKYHLPNGWSVKKSTLKNIVLKSKLLQISKRVPVEKIPHLMNRFQLMNFVEFLGN